MSASERLTEPLLRDGGQLRPVSWERALAEAALHLRRAGARSGALVGGEVTSEEGFLLARLMREGLGSPHIDSRLAGTLALELHQALGDPRLQASVPDLEFAHAVLVLECDPIEDAPILDLRLRKGARRHGTKLVRASAAELLQRSSELAQELKDAGEEVVILWSERLTAGADGARAAQALLELAHTLGLAQTDGAGLLEIPHASNGRGLREAGVLPNAGPGLREPEDAAEHLDGAGVLRALAQGQLSTLLLLQRDPAGEREAQLWQRVLERSPTVIACSALLTDWLAEHASVVLPAQAYAEKEGTIVHPDGRIQRLRPAVARPGSTRAQWLVIAELAGRIGLDLEVQSGLMASQQLFDAVPFYAGLTLEEIGPHGVRWQERDAAAAYPAREQLV